jgi:transposase
MDRNRVVWLQKGFGVEVFSRFCELLSEEERQSIEVVAGDGAKWIDTCVGKYFPNAKRCIDFFHVVSWVNDALDQTRRSLARKAQQEYERTKDRIDREIQEQKRAEQAAKEGYINAQRELRILKCRRGRPSKRRIELEAKIAAYEEEFNRIEPLSGERGRRGKYTGEQLSMLDALEQNASQIKGVKYALTMNSEDVQEQNQSRIDLIAASYPDLYRAYQLKERLRIILHLKDPYLAEKELRKWIDDARNSELQYFVPLADKIERHIANILRSIQCHANSAKSEATNTTIQALIKTARGFRNLDNMFALIMLRCSDIVIPLNNRYRPDVELQGRKRELANQRRADRENARRDAYGFRYSPTQGA